MAEPSYWDTELYEWLVSKSKASAAGLCSRADGKMYAASAHGKDATESYNNGWTVMYKDNYSVAVAQDDGTEKDTAISEDVCISKSIETGPGGGGPGLYIGGQKYRLVKMNEDTFKDPQTGLETTFQVMLCPISNKKGAVMVIGEAQVVIGIYDEEHEIDGVKSPIVQGNLTTALLEFAHHMFGAGAAEEWVCERICHNMQDAGIIQPFSCTFLLKHWPSLTYTSGIFCYGHDNYYVWCISEGI